MTKRRKIIAGISIGVAVLLALAIALYFTLFSAGANTIALSSTPNSTKAPTFTIKKINGFLNTTPAGVASSSLTKGIYLVNQSQKGCAAQFSTGYLPADQKGYGDEYLTKSYINTSTSTEGFKKGGLSTVYIKTTDGKKLAFTSVRYTNKVGIVTSQDGKNNLPATNFTTYLAVRAIDSVYPHKIVKSIGPDSKPVTASDKGVPVLVAEYQCANTTLKVSDWTKLLATQKVSF